MPDSAHVALTHQEPPSAAASGLTVEVSYGPNSTRLNIRLAQPISDGQPNQEQVATVLRQLGEALLRIAEKPSAISMRPPRHTK
jgi:hypothetical protein